MEQLPSQSNSSIYGYGYRCEKTPLRCETLIRLHHTCANACQQHADWPYRCKVMQFTMFTRCALSTLLTLLPISTTLYMIEQLTWFGRL